MKTQKPNLKSALEYCNVPKGDINDSFVGLTIADGNPTITFPIGYEFPNSLAQLRGDIQSLLSAIRMADISTQEKGAFSGDETAINSNLPFDAYSALLDDFMHSRRYLTTEEVQFSSGGPGTIDWTRTIGTTNPILTKSNRVVFTSVISRSNQPDSKSLITNAHQFALQQATKVLGWLYPDLDISSPAIPAGPQVYLAAVQKELNQTFNDTRRRLLHAIEKVLRNSPDTNIKHSHVLGTNRFEYVWEYMIERAFGSPNKQEYFPKTQWHFPNSRTTSPAPLQPDSIMQLRSRKQTFILDAKYYRYWATKRPNNLPTTSDISKQIIYGQYAAEIELTRSPLQPFEIYNAFLLPGGVSSESPYKSCAVAVSDWIPHPRSFEIISAIFVDTAFLLRSFLVTSMQDRIKLADKIFASTNRQMLGIAQ